MTVTTTAGTPWLFTPAKQKLLRGQLNLAADALKCILTTGAQTLKPSFLGVSGDARYSDITSELANGNGYTTGGVALTSVVAGYQVIGATVAAVGAGGTNGQQTLTATTGTGTKATFTSTITGGQIASLIVAANGKGFLTALPTNLDAEPLTGAAITGAQVALTLAAAIQVANPTFSGLTAAYKHALIYDNTSANKDLICGVDLAAVDLNGNPTPNGTLTIVNGPLTPTFDPSGLITLG